MMYSIYEDKENISTGTVSTAKTSLAGQSKLKRQVRKPLSNVGNTIQDKLPPPSKDDKKSPLKPLKKSTETAPLVQALAGIADPPREDDYPEIEHVPPFYEPEDDYEDIWPREERLSDDDIYSLKFFQHYNSVAYDAPPSPLSPFPVLEYPPLDQSMMEMDCLEEPSEIKTCLCPVPSL